MILSSRVQFLGLASFMSVCACGNSQPPAATPSTDSSSTPAASTSAQATTSSPAASASAAPASVATDPNEVLETIWDTTGSTSKAIAVKAGHLGSVVFLKYPGSEWKVERTDKTFGYPKVTILPKWGSPTLDGQKFTWDTSDVKSASGQVVMTMKGSHTVTFKNVGKDQKDTVYQIIFQVE